MKNILTSIFIIISLTTIAQVTINSASVKIDSSGIDTMFLNYTSYLGRPYTIGGVYGNSSCNYSTLQWFHFKDSIQSNSITIDTAFGIPFGNYEYGYYELNLVWDTLIRSTPPPVPFILMDSFIFDPCSTTSVNEINKAPQSLIQLYPNPAINQVNIAIDGDLSIEEIAVYTINGKMVSNLQKIDTQIDLFGYTPGIYYVRFNTNKGIISKKITITN